MCDPTSRLMSLRPSTVAAMCRRGRCFLLLAWLVACTDAVSGKRSSQYRYTAVDASAVAAPTVVSSSGSLGQAGRPQHPRLVGGDDGLTTITATPTTSSNSDGQGLAWLRPKRVEPTKGKKKKQDQRSGRDEGKKGVGLPERFASWGQSTTEPIARWKARHGSWFAHEDVNRKAQATAKASGLRPEYKLTFWGCMVAGAVSRSVAQTTLHPANVIKTLLQTKGSFRAILPLTWATLSRGAGAQFLLSLPNGALHFAVLENTKTRMAELFPMRSASFLLDFASCSAATAMCSVMSTPQMVLTNRIMAGVYPNLAAGLRSVVREKGVRGFYAGWWPGLVQKIPSYGLTWVLFQQVKDVHYKMAKRLPTNTENFWLGCIAAAGSVTIMIPMDTVKTRLVTQSAATGFKYNGILSCFSRMLREEGIGSFYNSLTPRLVSVVPMIGVQYLVYEGMKKLLAEVPEATTDGPGLESLERTKAVEELETVSEGV